MLFSKLYGTKSEREMKKLAPVISQINQKYESLSTKSQNDLLSKTTDLKEFVIKTRLDKEKSLSESMDKKQRQSEIFKAEQGALGLIMVEAFAIVKDTCRRMCGNFHQSYHAVTRSTGAIMNYSQ